MKDRLPEKCSQCNRKCTRFWGETADHWACEGHYIIMESNITSYEIDIDDDEVVLQWAKNRKAGYDWLLNNPEDV